MRLLPLLATLAIALPAYADFSYTSTNKTGGAMAGMAGGPTVSHHYYKGQKMKLDTGSMVMIIDMDARTITTLNPSARTYTVRSMDEAMRQSGDMPDVKINVKETGQTRLVNGFNASEVVMTMEMDPPAGRAGMGKMQMEMDMWISPDVPGMGELRSFYQKNAEKFPWSAMAAGANPSMAKAIADMQRAMVKMNGVPVEQIMRVRMGGGPGGAGAPQMSAEQQQKMQAAMAQLEAMKAQGGAQAAAAQQMMGRMGGMAGMGGGGASSAPMVEVTMDSSDFSGASIPDSVFAIPAGYQKAAN